MLSEQPKLPRHTHLHPRHTILLPTHIHLHPRHTITLTRHTPMLPRHPICFLDTLLCILNTPSRFQAKVALGALVFSEQPQAVAFAGVEVCLTPAILHVSSCTSIHLLRVMDTYQETWTPTQSHMSPSTQQAQAVAFAGVEVCPAPAILHGRGTTRAEDAQGTPTQSHISRRVLVYEDSMRRQLPSQASRCVQPPRYRI